MDESEKRFEQDIETFFLSPQGGYVKIEEKSFDLDKCISCYSCVNRCPQKAIKPIPDEKMAQIITSFVADSQRRQEPSLFF